MFIIPKRSILVLEFAFEICLWNITSTEGSENTISMMEAGMIPNVVDYYDVDTDPTGKFVPWDHLYSEG